MFQVDSFYSSLEKPSKSLAILCRDFIDWNVAFGLDFQFQYAYFCFAIMRVYSSGIELCISQIRLGMRNKVTVAETGSLFLLYENIQPEVVHGWHGTSVPGALDSFPFTALLLSSWSKKAGSWISSRHVHVPGSTVQEGMKKTGQRP